MDEIFSYCSRIRIEEFKPFNLLKFHSFPFGCSDFQPYPLRGRSRRKDPLRVSRRRAWSWTAEDPFPHEAEGGLYGFLGGRARALQLRHAVVRDGLADYGNDALQIHRGRAVALLVGRQCITRAGQNTAIEVQSFAVFVPHFNFVHIFRIFKVFLYGFSVFTSFMVFSTLIECVLGLVENQCHADHVCTIMDV